MRKITLKSPSLFYQASYVLLPSFKGITFSSDSTTDHAIGYTSRHVKRKEGEKTISTMKVDEQRSFLIQIVGHFKVHQLEDAIDAGDNNGNNDNAGGSTDEDC